MNAKACPICKQEDEVQILGQIYTQIDSNQYNCRRCGVFAITGPAWFDLQALNDIKRAPLAAYTRERTVRKLEVVMLTSRDYRSPDSPYRIPTISIDESISQFPKRVSDRVDRALLNLKQMSAYTGASFSIDLFNDSALLYSDSFEHDACLYMVNILKKSEFIEGSTGVFNISPAGWNRIFEIESARPNSDVAFIAMAFAPEYDHIWHAIEAGIQKAGFSPFRVNQSETNGKICDEIIAQIQRSKFVVADFSGQRKGVYFEAGYAMGLGIPVIWSCIKKEVDGGELHFDTRQYNHIDWETPEQFTTRLYNRIRATIF